MHWGEYIGCLADQQPIRVLILCESHHTNEKTDIEPGKPASYSTASVVETDYINQKGDREDYRNYQLFSKIEQSFGVTTRSKEERLDFWSKVYFGNYVPVLCGVRNDTAKKTINKQGNRVEYNNQLFAFIVEHSIDVVFCFSRLVFNNLPQGAPGDESDVVACGKIGRCRDYISRYQYCARTPHGAVTIELEKPLTVYGMRHPSASGGFQPNHYADYLSRKLQECQL